MFASPVVPHHIAIVMDGNGRWAKRRFLPRLAGHKQGVDSLRRCVRACAERGVGVLTVFAFSSENWNRPADEVSGLMELLALALGREVPQLKKDGVRLHFVGERDSLSPKVRDGLGQAEAATAASRGNPRCSIPTSEVVPPMSTTAQASSPERSAGPRRRPHRVDRR